MDQQVVQSRTGLLTYVVRRSIFFPIISLFSLQFFVLFIMFSARAILDFLIRDFQFDWSLNDLMNSITIILQFFNVFAVLYIVLDWLYSYYVFRPHEIIYRKGFLLDQRTDYRFDHIEKIDVRQGYIAKLLDYGTIVVYSGDLKEEIPFYDVPMPHKYAAIALKHAHDDYASRSKPYYVSTTGS